MKQENKISINHFIKRPNYFADRIIPLFKGMNLYESNETDNFPVFQNILNLADSKLTGWEMSTGRGLESTQRLARLFVSHKSAVEAEIAQKTERADFFWKETYKLLEDALKYQNKYKWEVLFGVENENPLKDNIEKLIQQIFIDTHCAFYNEGININDQLNTNSRAFEHIKYLEKVVGYSKLTKEDRFDLFEPAIKQELLHLKSNKDWAVLIKRCKNAINEYGANDFMLETMFGAYLTKAYCELVNGDSKISNLNDAETLNGSIKKFESLRMKYPDKIQIYQSLGDLYFLRSVKLANAAKLSKALLKNFLTTRRS